MKKITFLFLLAFASICNAQTDIWTSDTEDNTNWDSGISWTIDTETNNPGAGMTGTFFWGSITPATSDVLTSPSFFINGGFTNINFEMRIVDVVVPVASFQHSSYNVYIYDTAVNTLDDFNGSKTQILSGTVNQTIPNSYLVNSSIPSSFAGKTVGLFIEVTNNSSSPGQIVLVDDFKVSSLETLSVNNFEIAETYFYPNPTKGLTSIKTITNIDSVEVFNQLGQKIITYTKDVQTDLKIDLSEYNNGIYLVVIKDDGQKVTTKKLIKI
jgi:hypothetical protein